MSGIFIASAVYITTASRTQNTTKPTGNPQAVLPITPADHILGNPLAPVKIIEYSDLECSYCAQFQQTLRRIVNDYGPEGKVALVFREFPLTELHPYAQTAAEAAECVAHTAGNATFWQFIDSMFAHQPVTPKDIGSYVQKAGANPSAVASCIAAGSMTARVEEERKNALASGAQGAPFALITVRGTPVFTINGAYPYAFVKQQVDAALAVASSTAQI